MNYEERGMKAPPEARRVLAEIGGMVTEGTIRKPPGAAAADLWKRLP